MRYDILDAQLNDNIFNRVVGDKPDSSAINFLGWDDKNNLLLVIYEQSQSMYTYACSEKKYQSILASQSIGRAVSSFTRSMDYMSKYDDVSVMVSALMNYLIPKGWLDNLERYGLHI